MVKQEICIFVAYGDTKVKAVLKTPFFIEEWQVQERV